MAKLYKNSNGAFYDAFGGKIGSVEEIEEIEEEWAGDSFNRDTAVAMCNNAAFTTATCSIDDSTLKGLSEVVSISGDGTLSCSKGTVGDWDIAYSAQNDIIHEQLKKLQEQIDELKQEQKKRHEGIRSKLKTLKYEREVE